MPTVDATALAGLGAQSGFDAYFAWLDFVGSPLRACTWYDDVPLAGTGDSELDGTYEAVDPAFVDISDVAHGSGGSGTVTVTLSGIVGLDTSVLNIIGDRTKWYRRTLRLWMRVHDESGVQQGAIVPYYTGFMVDARIVPHPKSQTIEISAENYLNLIAEASNRDYLNQGDYDSSDLSAKATLAAANSAKSGPAAAVGFNLGAGRFSAAEHSLVSRD